MASINGINIKNVKTFSGIEYPSCTECTVYNGIKRLGTYCEDQWGGCGHFSPNSLYEELKPIAENYKAGCKESEFYNISDDPEVLIQNVINLRKMEKIFRANKKKGYPITLYVGNRSSYLSVGFISKVDIAKLPSDIKKAIQKEFPHNDYYIWQAVDSSDFDIIVDNTHPVPCFL